MEMETVGVEGLRDIFGRKWRIRWVAILNFINACVFSNIAGDFLAGKVGYSTGRMQKWERIG